MDAEKEVHGNESPKESGFFGSTLTRGLFGGSSPPPEDEKPPSVAGGGSVTFDKASSKGGPPGSRMSRATPAMASDTGKHDDHKFSIIPFGFGGETNTPPNQDDQYDEAEQARQGSIASGVELVEWIPTLPQLFTYFAITQVLIVFFWFVAFCTEDIGIAHMASAESWFQIASWVVLIFTTLLFLVYMKFIKNNLPRMLFATFFAFFAFVSFFHAPLTIADKARSYAATWSFFRWIFIAGIGLLYAVAYREELVPPRENLPPTARNFVVRNHLDTVPA